MTAPTPPIYEPRALELLRDVVRDVGYDYVTPSDGSCKYVIDGAPACIVGRALDRHGVPLAELTKGERNGMGITRVADHLADADVVLITPSATLLFDNAQMLQDACISWGDVLGEAECRARGLALLDDEAMAS